MARCRSAPEQQSNYTKQLEHLAKGCDFSPGQNHLLYSQQAVITGCSFEPDDNIPRALAHHVSCGLNGARFLVQSHFGHFLLKKSLDVDEKTIVRLNWLD
jgi:hypothetical protein